MSITHRRAAGTVRRLPVRASDVLAHYSADAGHDAGGPAGAAVSSWQDRRSTQRTLSQGTGANQPAFQPLGLKGRRALRSDGSADRMSNTGGSPFAGRTSACYVTVFSASANQTGKYMVSQPEASAGSNGVDGGPNGTNTVTFGTKTDSAAYQTTSMTGVPYADQLPLYTEMSWTLDRTGDEAIAVGTPAEGTFNYGNITGATIDASSGELAVFAFSGAGFFGGAAIDLHELVLLTRMPSIGERRRFLRYVERRWGLNHTTRPKGPWRDGTLSIVL